MKEFAWRPTSDIIEHARLTEFIRFAGCAEFADLHARSVADVAWFTNAVIQFLKIPFRTPYRAVVDLSGGPEWPRWCVDAELNIVQACLQHDADQPAVISESESGAVVDVSYKELREQVARVAGGLARLGISRGDRVGIYMPMQAETVIALLALGWLGAIAIPLFSGYGPAAIETRLNQTGAKALMLYSSFRRGGREIQMLTTAREAIARCQAVQHLVVAGADTVAGAISWRDLARGPAVEVTNTAAEDPLIIIFSSGTTGEPKGILHSHCSFPIKAAQDMALNMDIHAGDRISWITDLGWMMGPWVIYGALILGATVVLRDGAFDWPGPDALWQFTAKHRLDVLGVSPTLVRKLAEYGKPQTAGHDLSHLRFFASSGEPWDPASWWWLFQQVREKPVPIINYSGGTEISGGILSNHPLAPIKACGFAAPCPGMAADVVDEYGRTLPSGVGELAIRQPWIGQARGFWNDPERYRQTYWSRVPGLWIHGDWAERDEDSHWFIHGRSDDTLKVAGKRIGPAEVESVLCTHPLVIESAVIGIPDAMKGTALVGICVARATDGLKETLREFVGAEMGKPLRPDRIHFVSALPKTRNGKIVRRAIRAAYLNYDAGDVSAIENPATLEEIRNLNT